MDSTRAYKRLVSGELKIKTVSLKSEVWETFGKLSDNEGKELDFVACKKCCHVLCYKKGSSGTSTMKKHKCSLLGKGQPLLTAPVTRMPLTATKLPTKAIKESITKACVDYITEDLRAYDSIAGEGFLDMVDVVTAFNLYKLYHPLKAHLLKSSVMSIVLNCLMFELKRGINSIGVRY